jgi:hypothetical protein
MHQFPNTVTKNVTITPSSQGACVETAVPHYHYSYDKCWLGLDVGTLVAAMQRLVQLILTLPLHVQMITLHILVSPV